MLSEMNLYRSLLVYRSRLRELIMLSFIKNNKKTSALCIFSYTINKAYLQLSREVVFPNIFNFIVNRLFNRAY